MSLSDSTTMSASSPYGTRSSTWSPDTTAKSESLSPKLCAVAEEDDQDLLYDLLSTMSDPAAQDAAATLSQVANSGGPIASTSTTSAAAAAGSTSSSAVLAAAALMAGSNPSASTSNNTSQDAETSDVAILDPTLTAVASPNAQMPANYNKDLPMCANCLTQTTPLWRRSHDSSHILCNACALFFKMKGRPRPISLKTDVIKSRNRSKGKSTSKDRSNPSALTSTGSSATASPSALGASTSSSSSRTTSKSKERSMSRSRDAGIVGRKSGPGMDEEDAEMEDGRNKPFNDGAFSEVDSNGRKARKTGLSPNNVAFGQPPSIPPGYPGAYPYPYPYYQPHPLAPSHHHHHHPYPPPRSRSRSTDGRRAQSLDSRPTSAERAPAGGAPRPGPYGYPLPPPPGYHPANPGLHATTPPEGYYPPYGYPPPPGFVGQHSMPPGYYPPPLFGAQAHAQAHVQAQAQASYAHSSQTQSQHPAIAHAQSNSRSRSPATAPTLESGTIGGGNPASTSASAGVTASPPHPSASNSALYPGPRQLPQGYSHSPLGGTNPVPRSQLNGADGRLTLAPLVSNGNRSPRLSDDHATMASDQNGQTERIHLPSVTSISASTAPMMPSVFAPQYPRHRRATSVSSTSAGSVVSTGSAEEGVRSPETNARRTLAAPPPRAQAGTGLAAGRADVPGSPHDERRGRPEKRDRDGTSNNAFSSFKGKGREGAEDLSEIDELEGDTADDDDAFSNGDGRRSMMNVEASLGDLRVDRHRKPHGGAYDGSASPLSSNQNEDSSRSRSSGRGTSREGRGRSRGQYGGGTAGRSAASSASRSKTARQGSASSSMSRSAGSSLSAEAQIRRLKTKVAELTFLNGLMVSRLSQLEGPGRVPLTQSGTMTSLSAETPRPTDDYSEHEQDEEAFRDDPSDGGGDEEMYGDEALREDEELERYGVSVSSQDPAMRQQLLAFVKAQRAQGLSGMSARAET